MQKRHMHATEARRLYIVVLCVCLVSFEVLINEFKFIIFALLYALGIPSITD